MAVKRDGEWVSWNWVEYQRDVRNTAKGFLACGLERQCGVGIMAHNCPGRGAIWNCTTMPFQLSKFCELNSQLNQVQAHINKSPSSSI